VTWCKKTPPSVYHFSDTTNLFLACLFSSISQFPLQNGGRNTALRHAKSIRNAHWVMPFDGNCFLSLNGFQEIRSQLERHGHNTKYFVVPMTRLLNNSILLDGMDEKPKTPEEPQLIFRYDSEEEYNPNMRYGRRSKVRNNSNRNMLYDFSVTGELLLKMGNIITNNIILLI
jgi:hypothetical protein